MKTGFGIMSVLMLASIGMDAATVSLTPVADTTLQSMYPGNNFGADSSFQAGGRRYGGVARGLLQFDLSSVPAGSTINSVSLTLTVTRTPTAAGNSLFDLHRVLEPWGEGDNTGTGGTAADTDESSWIYRFAPGTRWTNPGGTFSPAVSASHMITGDGSYTFTSTPALVNDVQSWLNNRGYNFGWELVSENETYPATIRRFGSRDAGAAAPLLNITYTPVPEPGMLPLFCVSGVGLWLVLCQSAKRKHPQ